MMVIARIMLKMVMESYSIPMVFAIRDSSRITFGMGMESFVLTRYRYIEANGKMTNCQDKAKLETSQ
jgi:hypothetical protein